MAGEVAEEADGGEVAEAEEDLGAVAESAATVRAVAESATKGRDAATGRAGECIVREDEKKCQRCDMCQETSHGQRRT